MPARHPPWFDRGINDIKHDPSSVGMSRTTTASQRVNPRATAYDDTMVDTMLTAPDGMFSSALCRGV